jgi:hypothetical protein
MSKNHQLFAQDPSQPVLNDTEADTEAAIQHILSSRCKMGEVDRLYRSYNINIEWKIKLQQSPKKSTSWSATMIKRIILTKLP